MTVPSMLKRTPVLLLAFCGLAGCDDAPPPESDDPVLPAGAEARSLLGETFFPPPLPANLDSTRTEDLEVATSELAVDPDDPELWIWVGRREAYLGRYRAAIATFTDGLERFPDDARFLRHRGHRWITVREFDRAVEDLSTGTEWVRGQPDEIEPDGLPNPLGIPLSTLQFNLWYHLGLAHYLRGDWEAARPAWESCLDVSTNPDLQVATRYWLYLTLRRLGEDDEAQALLEDLPTSEEIIENEAYHRLLLHFRGDLSEEEVTGGEEPGSLTGTTMAYGIGIGYVLEGREDEAMAVFQRILEAPDQWPAFGYVAAEAEVARTL